MHAVAGVVRSVQRQEGEVMDHPPCPVGPRSGRTQWMIDRLLDAITEGQPRSVVVGMNSDHAANCLLPRVMRSMIDRRLSFKRVDIMTLDCDGSIITFSSPEQAIKNKGKWTSGEFWDHSWEGIHE